MRGVVTSDDLTRRRRYFAEEIQAVSNLTSPALVDAFATVPRERFLGPKRKSMIAVHT